MRGPRGMATSTAAALAGAGCAAGSQSLCPGFGAEGLRHRLHSALSVSWAVQNAGILSRLSRVSSVSGESPQPIDSWVVAEQHGEPRGGNVEIDGVAVDHRFDVGPVLGAVEQRCADGEVLGREHLDALTLEWHLATAVGDGEVELVGCEETATS